MAKPAPVYDFDSREVVVWSTSTSPNMAQQTNLDAYVAHWRRQVKLKGLTPEEFRD